MRLNLTKLTICVSLIIVFVVIYVYYPTAKVESKPEVICENGVCMRPKKVSDNVSISNVEDYSLNEDEDIDLGSNNSFVIDEE